MDVKIALAGNPNCGKTTLFNALTGSNQFVGNWPGVTVEKKEGRLKGREELTAVDLPGIYSLSPYTLEEVVARNYLIGERPDVILNIIDATNLERSLYLTTQLVELGIPVVIALNMMDVVRKNGDQMQTEELSRRIGCPIVEISAMRGEGLEDAVNAAVAAAKKGNPVPMHTFSGVVEHAVAHIEEAVLHEAEESRQRWYAVKIFERDEKVIEELGIDPEKLAHIEKDIVAAERELDDDAESIITNERYVYIAELLEGCYKRKKIGSVTLSDKIDRVVTNRYLALPIFAAVMFVVYFISVSTVGTWVTDWMNDGLFGEGFTLFGKWVPGVPVLVEKGLTAINCWPWLQGLILNGIVAGVGAVLGFVPQILVLFLFLSFLEACGYMSRIAFVLDRLFCRFGLSGKSFIPMLVGTGCSVPGIMASRTIENERDRRMTVMTTPFIPCSAKLPFIAMMAGAIFGGAWWVAPSAYFLGIAAVVLSGLILKKTKRFQGDVAPFVMELPSYHMPTVKSVAHATWERGWSFIKKAGTIILLSSVAVWFATYFGVVNGTFRMLSDEEISHSILAYLGKGVAWIFAPLGFGTWEAAVASLTGLVAKENIVGTMSIVLGGGEASVYAQMASMLTVSAGYAFLAFNLLCAPCFAAIGAIKREMNNRKWTWFAIGYQTAFAYGVALVVNQFGNLFSGNLHGTLNVLSFIAAVLVVALAVYLVVRPQKTAQKNKKAK